MTDFPKQVTRWQASDGTQYATPEGAQHQELVLLLACGLDTIDRILKNREAVIRILNGLHIRPSLESEIPASCPSFDWSKLAPDWVFERFVATPAQGRIRHIATGCEYYPYLGGFFVRSELANQDAAHQLYLQAREAALACRRDVIAPPNSEGLASVVAGHE